VVGRGVDSVSAVQHAPGQEMPNVKDLTLRSSTGRPSCSLWASLCAAYVQPMCSLCAAYVQPMCSRERRTCHSGMQRERAHALDVVVLQQTIKHLSVTQRALSVIHPASSQRPPATQREL
jgi:hypothetical protein